jgi:hypothetical protein
LTSFGQRDDFVAAPLSIGNPADRDTLDDISLTVPESGSAAGQYDADSCRCSVCDRMFRDVEDFDRHRSRGRCQTPDAPHAELGSRDALDDVGLTNTVDRVGSGDRAQHAEAAMPT